MTAPDPVLHDEGLLCVEASAGTGKTHLLSTLAVRWLVERDDVRIAELLVVTYTVVAAAELRGRIRERLADVRDRLRREAAGDDPFCEALAHRADARDVLARAERALAEFDTASISTIHGFAAAALGTTVGAVGPGEDRRRQAVADVLAVAAFDPATPMFDAPAVSDATFDSLVRLRLDNPDLDLAPHPGADAPPAAMAHREAVARAVALFEARSRRDGLLTYADLLTELARAIESDDAPLLAALRRRFRVGLIDEFQDTDPTQWRIFERLFLEAPGRSLVVVGDPKQAIYGFRGADVATYLRARTRATTAPHGLGVHELTTNYRSDGQLLDALNGLFEGASLDEGGEIAYVAVAPAEGHADAALVGRDGAPLPPLALRVAPAEGTMGVKRRAIADECAAEAAAVLDAGVLDRDGHRRSVTEDDVVVLCESGTQFSLLREAFLRRGIRTTVARSDDVLSSPAALDVAVVLRALRDPGDGGAVAAVAHAWCGGSGEEDRIARARSRLGAWGQALEERGVAALARALTDPAATEGLLQDPRGERLLTDVHHLFELLAASAPPGAGAAQLYEAMEELVAGIPSSSVPDELRARRIETDAPAVRLMTVHGAKGLEYDVVLCPFIQRVRDDDRDPTVWRDAATSSRLVDAGGGEAWTDERLEAADPKERSRRASSAVGSENRRLVYVALTRARHRCVVWWLPAYGQADRRRDELTSLLLDRDESHRPILRPRAARKDVECYDLRGAAALERMATHLAPLVASGVLDLAPVAVGQTPPLFRSLGYAPRGLAPLAALGVADLGRTLTVRQGRCSFTSLVSGGHAPSTTLDATVGDAGASDEADEDDPDGVAAGPVDRLGAQRGTGFGSAVHEALEAALTRSDDTPFDEALASGLERSLRRRGLAPDPAASDGLRAACRVPIAGGRALCELGRLDAATELRFRLPVADGVDLSAIAALLADGDRDGPFGGWARELASRSHGRVLAAALVGAIDLVTTLGSPERVHVVDYKTNVVSGVGAYGPDSLAGAMQASDYPLQAAIYLVALHRYLRWRRADYDPERHLGDAHYLFLRGMREGSAEGACTWSPGPRAIVALSDLLAGAA